VFLPQENPAFAETEPKKSAPDKPVLDFDLRNPSMMVNRPGWLARLIGALLFRRVRFDDEHVNRIQELHQEGSLVYVMSSQSLLDYLYFNWVFLRKKLPLAVFGKGMRMWPFRSMLTMFKSMFRWVFGRRKNKSEHDILRHAPHQKKPVVLFLRKARAILPWWGEFKEDPLRSIVAAQRQMDDPIILLPLVLVWERKPSRFQRSLFDILFGNPDAPGRLRKLFNFLRHRKRALVQLAAPLNLKEFLEEHEHLQREEAVGQKVRWALNRRIYLEERIIRGPVLKPAKRMREEILRLKQVEQLIQTTADNDKRSPRSVRKKVRRYLKEIVADWKLGVVEFLCFLLTFIFSRIYAGIEVNGLNHVRDAARQAPLVILPCHRSHSDYLLISYVFYAHGLVPPHIAAGKNLSFWPLGPLFRRGGAFFLRRGFRQNPIYKQIFETYFHKLLKEGYSIEFFLEGGRSRTGKLIRPRYGLLTHVVNSVVAGHAHDLRVCPAAIGYEKIIEGASFLDELSGVDKDQENITELLRATKVLRSRYGRVYLNFDESFSVRDFLLEHDVDLENGFRDEDERKMVVKRLGYRVLTGINHSMVSTPSAVVATALLGNSRRGISRQTLLRRVGAILEYLLRRNVPFSSSFKTLLSANRVALEQKRTEENATAATALAMLDGRNNLSKTLGDSVGLIVDQSTAMLASAKLINRHKFADDAVYQVPPHKRQSLDYYRNNLVHHFVREGMLAAALLGCRSMGDIWGDRVKKETLFLSKLLKYEFVYEQGRSFDDQYRETIQLFQEAKLIEGDRAAKITIPPESQRVLRLLANMSLPVIEGYFVVSRTLTKLKGPQPKKVVLQWIQLVGERLWREGDITYREAVSSVTFNNAVDWLMNQGIVSRVRQSEGRKTIEYFEPGPRTIEDPDACETIANRLSRFLIRID